MPTATNFEYAVYWYSPRGYANEGQVLYGTRTEFASLPIEGNVHFELIKRFKLQASAVKCANEVARLRTREATKLLPRHGAANKDGTYADIRVAAVAEVADQTWAMWTSRLANKIKFQASGHQITAHLSILDTRNYREQLVMLAGRKIAQGISFDDEVRLLDGVRVCVTFKAGNVKLATAEIRYALESRRGAGATSAEDDDGYDYDHPTHWESSTGLISAVERHIGHANLAESIPVRYAEFRAAREAIDARAIEMFNEWTAEEEEWLPDARAYALELQKNAA